MTEQSDIPSKQSPIIGYSYATDKDLIAVKILQNENLKKNVDPANFAKGFVSVETSAEQLRSINEKYGLVVAKDERDKVVGYSFPLDESLAMEHELLFPFVEELKVLPGLQGRNWFIGGQTCVDKEFRRQGLNTMLTKARWQNMKDKGFDYMVTEIGGPNTVSLAANSHLKVLKSFLDPNLKDSDGKPFVWNIIGLDLRKISDDVERVIEKVSGALK